MNLLSSRLAPLTLVLALCAPAAWAAPFTPGGDGTVTDAATGLAWDRCAWGQSGSACEVGAPEALPWADALAHAQAANQQNHLGHADWRVPNLKELESLVDLAAADPAIDATAFPATPASVFWSSTTDPTNTASARAINFYDGSSSGFNKSRGFALRLVRGGTGATSFDAQAPAPSAAPTAVPTLSQWGVLLLAILLSLLGLRRLPIQRKQLSKTE